MGFSRQEYWSGLPLLSPHDIIVALKAWIVQENGKFKGSLLGKVLPTLYVYYLLFLLQQLINLRALNIFPRLKLLLCFDTNFEEH